MVKKSLSDVADQVIRAVSQLPDADPRASIVRQHLQSLIAALTPASQQSVPAMRQHLDTPAETPNAITDMHFPPIAAPPSDLAPRARTVTVAPVHLNRPGLQTDRRSARKAAGVTLKQVAAAAKTTLPTARMYETKRTAVRPDKRLALDHVYKSFRRE